MSIGAKQGCFIQHTDVSVNHSLRTTDCEKDLGIWITSTIQPCKHLVPDSL